MKINEDLLKNISSDMTINGNLTVNQDINNNALSMFNDTPGNTWQDFLKNKLDYCVANINTSKENIESFINGGWYGHNYGFGIFSKIGDVYQVIWFGNFGIYYCRKISNQYEYKQIEFEISNYERITGTYNGKPLYRQSYTVTGDNYNTQILSAQSDVDTIVSITGWVKKGSQIRNINTCYFGDMNWASQIYFDFSNNNIIIESGDLFKDFKNGATISITMEYTKTTD